MEIMMKVQKIYTKIEEVCEYCGFRSEKFFVHLETGTRDFYWCDSDCFTGDTEGWFAVQKVVRGQEPANPQTFLSNISDWQDEHDVSKGDIPF